MMHINDLAEAGAVVEEEVVGFDAEISGCLMELNIKKPRDESYKITVLSSIAWVRISNLNINIHLKF